MQQLAKECISAKKELFEAVKFFNSKRETLKASIKHSLSNMVGVNVYVRTPLNNNMYFSAYYETLGLNVVIDLSNNGEWRMVTNCKHESEFTETDKKFIACAQSIVDKLNGKEVEDDNS